MPCTSNMSVSVVYFFFRATVQKTALCSVKKMMPVSMTFVVSHPETTSHFVPIPLKVRVSEGSSFLDNQPGGSTSQFSDRVLECPSVGFHPRRGTTKDCKNGHCLSAWHSVFRLGFWGWDHPMIQWVKRRGHVHILRAVTILNMTLLLHYSIKIQAT